MEWNFKKSKFKGQISILYILFQKKTKFMKLVTCDSIQDVHSSYEKELDILTSHKKFYFQVKFY